MSTGESATQAAMSCPACSGGYAEGLVFCPNDGSRLVEQSKAAGITGPVGKVLADRYRIVRKLGEGGMGEVFEAQHIYIDKRFAIKTLRPEITSNPEAIARFHQEARSASMIGHDNIVEIDDFGRLPDGSVYLAMEFLDGRSLAERMREAPPLAPSEALDIAAQVCRGLGAAHAKSIIHRDLKPENVFLTRKNGHVLVKVLDFGIAKVVGATDQRLTQTGAIFGTPYYMSPEQALGHPLDQRADVYSLGVILYEMFTGCVPFQGDSFMGILSQHITKPPAAPSSLPSGRSVSMAIERVILKAMAKDPASRYQSMDELLAEIVRVQPSPAGSPSPSSSPVTESSRGTVDLAAHTWPDGSSRRPGPLVDAHKTFSPMRSSAEVMFDAAPETDGPALELAAPRRYPTMDPSFGEPRAGAGRTIALAVAGVLLLGGAGAAVVALTRHAAPIEVPPTPAAISSPPSLLPAPKPVPDVRPGESEVVIDSVPALAKIFAGGKLVGETPDVVKVPTGETLEVLLRRDGYATRQLLLDPAHERKVIVRLEREHHSGSSTSGTALPHLGYSPPPDPEPSTPGPGPAVAPARPAPSTTSSPSAATAAPPPRTRAPSRGPRSPSDPYAPAATPVHRPPRAGEVIDPYQ